MATDSDDGAKDPSPPAGRSAPAKNEHSPNEVAEIDLTHEGEDLNLVSTEGEIAYETPHLQEVDTQVLRMHRYRLARQLVWILGLTLLGGAILLGTIRWTTLNGDLIKDTLIGAIAPLTTLLASVTAYYFAEKRTDL